MPMKPTPNDVADPMPLPHEAARWDSAQGIHPRLFSLAAEGLCGVIERNVTL